MRRGRRLLVGATVVLTTAVLPVAPAHAATWRAVVTTTGSGLGATTETFDASTVDYDRDGDEDVWVGYHDQGGRLLRNDGNGVYSRVAATAWPKVDPVSGKVPDRHHCAWADVDLDGRPDSYCAVGRGGNNDVKTGKDNELWLQRSPGAFVDVGTAWGVGDVCGRSHYAAFLDADGDPYPDLYVGNAPPRTVTGDPCDNPANGLTDERSKLFVNRAGTGFRHAPELGIGGNGGVRCAEVLDIDRDGWEDLLTCGPDGMQLWRNRAGTGFADVAAAWGLATVYSDADVGDVDGDGDADLVTARWGQFGYRLNTGARFAPEVRVGAVPAGGGGRSVALGDADGDGDLDVYGLVSNVAAGTNPGDFVYLNAALRFTALPVPAASGIGDRVATLRGNRDARSEFLVLNGLEVAGPVQRVEVVLR